jgi:hypothetical protein
VTMSPVCCRTSCRGSATAFFGRVLATCFNVRCNDCPRLGTLPGTWIPATYFAVGNPLTRRLAKANPARNSPLARLPINRIHNDTACAPCFMLGSIRAKMYGSGFHAMSCPDLVSQS